jgi:hypothetical protein
MIPKAVSQPPRSSRRWASESCGSRSGRGRSEVVVLVREVVQVTAVHFASCGESYGRVPARPTKGAKEQRAKPPVSLFLPREMRLPSLVVASDATAAVFWA